MAGVLRQGFFPPGEARATSISRSGSVRSEQPSLERKELPPFGLRPVWPVASLLVGHSPTSGNAPVPVRKHLAPRHRPNWAQQNTSHFGDTTLDQLSRLVHTIQTIPSALRQHGRVSFFTPTSRGGCDSKPCQTVAGGGAER